MWSKCGMVWKAARRNTFNPHPVSGVASRRMEARTLFAMRDPQRLAEVSRRFCRQPAMRIG